MASAPATSPSVTVIILSHNYGRYLRQCVDSVLAQRDIDLHVVVVDDASSDETPQITEALARRDPRVQVVRNSANLGQLPSLNAALDDVETEFVVKLDADDLLTPGSLARSAALLVSHPSVAFVYGCPEHFMGSEPAMQDAPTRSWTIWKGSEWFARRCRSGTNVILQPEAVMRTEAVRQVGPVREYLPHTFDMHLWMQLSLLGDVGRVNGALQAFYRVHDKSLQHTAHAGLLFDLRGRRDAFDSVFQAEARDLPDAGVLRDQAHRALAASALDSACKAYDLGRPGSEHIDGLVAFAAETYSLACELPSWKALQRRRSGESNRARLLLDAKIRSARDMIAWLRWRRTGER